MCWAAEQSFTSGVGTPSVARTFVSAQLQGLFGANLRGGRFDDAALLVSELTTNALRAGAATVQVSVRVHQGELELGVADDGPGWPTRAQPRSSDPHGRGLMLVDAIADSWRAELVDTGGKRVIATFEVPLEWTMSLSCDQVRSSPVLDDS
jgi:anti-sigma regulatory factor (Ser/Thr protein kinase)